MLYKILFTLILSVAFQGNVYACSCGDMLSVSEAVRDAMVVIDARVLYKTEDGLIKYKVFVNQSFKGGFKWQDSLTISSMPTDATCGIPFENGQRYIIYAYPMFDNSDENKIVGYITDICTRTRKYSVEEIDALNKVMMGNEY